MSYEINGKTVETDANGYLVDINEWNEDVAVAIAKDEGLELTQEHWDLIHFLRDAYVNETPAPSRWQSSKSPFSTAR